MSPPSVSTKAISFLRFQPPAYGDSEKITYPALAVKATLLDLGFNKEVENEAEGHWFSSVDHKFGCRGIFSTWAMRSFRLKRYQSSQIIIFIWQVGKGFHCKIIMFGTWRGRILELNMRMRYWRSFWTNSGQPRRGNSRGRSWVWSLDWVWYVVRKCWLWMYWVWSS